MHARTGASLGAVAAAVRAAGGRVTGTSRPLGLLEVEATRIGAALLRRSPLVEWLHREHAVRIAGVRPNDPLFPAQWPLDRMGALRGWRIERGAASEVVVAVVDSGVDYSHPDLKDRMVDGFDFVNRDDDPVDDHGHGTHVAGIVAAEPDNRRGIAGVSWGASIMPLKACNTEGACGTFDVAASIAFAAVGGARVVNISLSGPHDSCPPEFLLAAALAEQHDVLLVASSGNSAQDGNPVMYPAACDGYVAVGATAQDDRWAPFSEHGDYVDLSAPGVRVPSTLPPGLTITDDPATPGYGPADGTSMAAPHVAGLAALLFAHHPEWTPLEVEEHMEATAVDLGPRGADDRFGAGRIDIGRAPAVALLAALVGGALATGVAAQTRAYCAAVTVRGAWEHIALPSFATGPQEMTQYAVDPANPDRLYATNGVSVAVSGDGGCSWRTTFRLDQPPDGADYSAEDSTIADLAAAPGHALLAISQRDGARPHVVLSAYSGETWRRGDDGLRTVLGRPLAVALTPANPAYAYLLVQERAGSGDTGVALRQSVFESTTAGGAWGVRGDPGPLEPGLDVPLAGSVLGGTTLAEVVPDPVEAGRLFLYGPDGLFHHQQGQRTRLMQGDVSAVLVGRTSTAADPLVVAAARGTRQVDVSSDGGASFVSFAVPGDVDSFAEALRPGDFYYSSADRLFLRSGGSSTEVEGGGGVRGLTFARSTRQISFARAQEVLTLYGRTDGAIVRKEETRTIDLVPGPDSVTVGNLPPIDPKQALPGTLTPEKAELTLLEGRSATIDYELYLPETPTPLDVFFDVDTTRSMLPTIDGLRASIANIILELTAARIDAQFGVGQYRGFETEPAFQRMYDINPPGPGLAAALNRLMAGDGATETQLESLRQIATGAGSITGVGIAPGQDATWRKGSLRIVVNMTDEPISDGPLHPTYEEVARVMLEDDIVHFGIAVQNEATAEALGPPLPGLIRIARETRSFAPAEGVDCDGDDDSDLYEGEPLVCVIDHASSADAGVLGGAIISVLRSLRDVGEVALSATVSGSRDGPVATAVPDEPLVSGVDFKSNNRIDFSVEITCPSLDATRKFPVDIEAEREAGVLAAASVALTCKAKPEPEPDPVPPAIPPAVVVALIPPPPLPPPVNPGPHQNPNPNPQPQPQMQPQPQSQPQGALATQRQTQPQLAVVQQRNVDFAPAEARRGASEEYALSSYAPPRPGPNGAMLGFAAAIVIAFGSALLAMQRVELRFARQRSFRYANDLRRRR